MLSLAKVDGDGVDDMHVYSESKSTYGEKGSDKLCMHIGMQDYKLFML